MQLAKFELHKSVVIVPLSAMPFKSKDLRLSLATGAIVPLILAGHNSSERVSGQITGHLLLDNVIKSKTSMLSLPY